MAVADQESVGFVTEAAKKRSNYSLPPHYLEFGATHVVIHKGEKLPLRDLIYAMMVHSADDASNVIAQHVGGTIPRFMQDLNRYLKELGCNDTQYLNPHGLHHPQHVTTAYGPSVAHESCIEKSNVQGNCCHNSVHTSGNRISAGHHVDSREPSIAVKAIIFIVKRLA